MDDENDDHNPENDDDDTDDEDDSYTLSTGNQGLVLINQMTDYLNRGAALDQMCFWEYRAQVYKTKFTDEELKKKGVSKKCSRECEQVFLFSSDHPQCETHWQKMRIKGSALVPTLSKLPPSNNKNKLRYQQCILLLFKPFSCFEELYNGISWEDTYSQFLAVTEHTRCIENIDELHKGIEDKDSDNNENNDENDEIADDECDDDPSEENEVDDGLDPETSRALDVIRNDTTWLDDSIRNHRNNENVEPLFDANSQLPRYEIWKADMDKQNKDRQDEPDEESEIYDEPSAMDVPLNDDDADQDIEFTLESVEEEADRVRRLRDEIICERTLNVKQRESFLMITENMIKRHLKEKTEQLIGYVGGPGGTGKSQVINAVREFCRRLHVEHTLKLSANTGTAAKHIGGSTTTTLFGFSSTNNARTLQARFEKVNTIIIDEVSMIGCRQLAKISKALSTGKRVGSTVPFGGVDIIFFGDFIQFPPVKDSPLYSGWFKPKGKAKHTESENQRQLGAHFWRQLNKIILLTEQMRCTDQAYLDLLNRLREGKCTKNDVTMLNGRIVGPNVDITSIVDVPIITPGNKLVMAVNDLFVDRYSHETLVYVSKSEDYQGKKKNGKAIPKKVADKIKDWPNTSTSGLPRELKLFVGMPVMITNNIATELGITNGTFGKIKSIHLQNGEEVTETSGYHQMEQHPEYIIVELKDINMRTLDGLPPNHVPISVKSASFSVKLPGKKKPINVNRSHFPMVPLFSCTAHKSQGQTLKQAIVDLVPSKGRKVTGIEFAYVPLSRVRRLQDLTILREFNPSILRTKVNEDCAAMMAEFKERDLCKDM